jgi:hypothetical protein
MMIAEEALSPCHFFQLQSRYVWERIAFARKMNLRISETSVTEELLYHFYQYFETFRVPVRLFESVEERRNGSDLEVLIKSERGFILLACQAKITYKSGNYKSFHHEVGGARQIDLLQAYAKRHGGIAQYLFYNFIPDWMMAREITTIKNISDQGITHLAADEIREWMKGYEEVGRKPPVPGFHTFHPMAALPFHQLICALLRGDLTPLRAFPDEVVTALSYYDEEDVSDAASWRRITSLAKIGHVTEEVIDKQHTDQTSVQALKKQKEPPYFKPKFRLVIGGENSSGGIFSIE